MCSMSGWSTRPNRQHHGIDNWRRMLPSIVATRGLVSVSLLDAVERFVASLKPLLAIEREFSKGDPVLVRAAVFSLLPTGRAC